MTAKDKRRFYSADNAFGSSALQAVITSRRKQKCLRQSSYTAALRAVPLSLPLCARHSEAPALYAVPVPVGSEFRANTFTVADQFLPAVAMDDDGDFVVTWTSRDQDGSSLGAYAQRYNAAGVPKAVNSVSILLLRVARPSPTSL